MLARYLVLHAFAFAASWWLTGTFWKSLVIFLLYEIISVWAQDLAARLALDEYKRLREKYNLNL